MDSLYKRSVIITCLTCSCLLTSLLQAQVIELRCDAPELIYNNHVGNEWGFGFQIGSEILSITKPCYASLAQIDQVEFVIGETNETYNDRTSAKLNIDTKEMNLNAPYSKKIEITIRESNGRYAGNTAK